MSISFALSSLSRLRAFPAAAVLLLLTTFPSLLAAQTSDASAGEADTEKSDPSPGEVGRFRDVIEVTARKRTENAQEIPISVTAFDQDALDERSVRDLSDLSELTANMDFSVSGGFGDGTSDAVVFIRGVGQIDTALFSDSGVGIYVDGVYLARSQGGVLDLLDVERVEVLRGPQGTLFGKNTNGGAIQLITRAPAEQRGGRLETTVGRFDRVDGRLSVDLPVSETTHTSFGLMTTNRDGWSRSLVTGQEFYDDHRDLGRFAVHWTPSTSFSARLSSDFTREREAGGSQVLLEVRNTDLISFYNRVLTDQGFDPYTVEQWGTDTYAESYSVSPSFVNRDVWGTHLHLDWLREGLSVQSITAYRSFEIHSLSDGDGAPNRVAEREIDQDHYQVSQEIQLAGDASDSDLQWLVGAIYFSERPREVNRQRVLADLYDALELAPGAIYAPPGVPDFLCSPGPTPEGLPCLGGMDNPDNFLFFVGPGTEEDLDLETDSWAIFSEATWALADRLSLTLGGRFTEDRKSFAYRSVNGLGEETSNLFNQETWSDWSGRAALSFQARPRLLLYTSLSRGFKSGGFNGRPQQRQALDEFDPETVLSWEGGIKSDWLDRRLRLNGAAFFSRYDDIHFAASVDVGGMPVFITQNAGDAEIRGAELELQAYPAPTVQVIASVGYLDSEIVSLDPRVPENSVRLGNVLPKAPSWTYALGVQSSRGLKNRAALISRLDYAYREKTYPDFANTEAISQPGYGLLSARILYAPADAPWDLALFGTNLADEEYLETGFSTGAFGIGFGVAGRPREWGLEASWRF